jgi:5,10-methylenetetrahydromethanopterin reductase
VLSEGGRPSENRLQWIGQAGPKVPVDVAATGPRVIQIAARVADRITFAVGASPERIQWAIDIATKEMDAFGRRRDEVVLGAVVEIFVAPSRAEARETIAGAVAAYARFNVMHGKVSGPMSDATRHALETVHDNYSMNDHVRVEAKHGRGLPDEMVDEFAIAGPVDYCIERMQTMIELGLTKFNMVNATFRADDPTFGQESHGLLATEVLPALR